MNTWTIISYQDHTLFHFALHSLCFNKEWMNHPGRYITVACVMLESQIIWVLI